MKKTIFGSVFVFLAVVVFGVITIQTVKADERSSRAPVCVQKTPPPPKPIYDRNHDGSHENDDACDVSHVRRAKHHDDGEEEVTCQAPQTLTPIVVLSPANNLVTNTSLVTFTGTTSPLALVTATSGALVATTSANITGDWSFTFSLGEGTTTVSFVAKDPLEASSTAVTRTVVVDTTAPAPVVPTVPDCANSLLSVSCLIPSVQATVAWTKVSDAAHYSVYVNGLLAGDTTGASLPVTLIDAVQNTILVVDYDAVGNASTSVSVLVSTFIKPLVINEVGWSGTTASSTDQYLELKNRTPYTLDLSHMALLATEGGTQYIPLQGSITPSGLYLIERTQQVINGPIPQLITPFAPLATTGEQLSLQWKGSATTTLDATPAVATCSGWCAGRALGPIGSSVEEGVTQATRSMERSQATDGSLSSTWFSNDTYTKVGTDLLGTIVYGTPGTANSLNQPDAGWYCNPDQVSIVPNQVYHPQGGNCTYLASFISYPSAGAGALFKGTPGNATLVTSGSAANYFGRPGQTGSTVRDTIATAVPGDQFFVGIWEPHVLTFPNPADNESFILWFTIGHRLLGDTTQGFTLDPGGAAPHENYRTIPFVMGE